MNSHKNARLRPKVEHTSLSRLSWWDFLKQHIARESASVVPVSGRNALYSMAPVPEPKTYAMLLAGLGLVGLHGPPQGNACLIRLSCREKPAMR